jgi:hypothetical protein
MVSAQPMLWKKFFFYAQLAQIVLEIVHYTFQPWGWNETMMNEIIFYFNLCAPILPP